MTKHKKVEAYFSLPSAARSYFSGPLHAQLKQSVSDKLCDATSNTAPLRYQQDIIRKILRENLKRQS